MAKELVKFKRGKAGLLPEQRDPGSLLVEEDTGSVMLDIGENEADRITLKDNTKVPLERKVNGKSLESDIDLTPDDIDADAKGTAASKVTSHNQNAAAHPYILDQINSVSSSLSGYVPTSRTINKKALTNNISLTHSDVGADKAGTAKTEVSTHNTSSTAHNDIRVLLSELSTKVTNFLDTDDATADQLSELIALIRDNASDIEQITNGKVNVSDIVDNLSTPLSNKPLSANQGVIIQKFIEDIAGTLLDHTLDESGTAHNDIRTELSDHKSDNSRHVTQADRDKWDAASAAGSGYVKKTGDIMTGPLTINSSDGSFDCLRLNTGGFDNELGEGHAIGGHAGLLYIKVCSPTSPGCTLYYLPNHTPQDEDMNVEEYQILTSKEPVPVEFGGTGSSTPEGAREAIDAVCRSGDTMVGPLTLAATQSGQDVILKFQNYRSLSGWGNRIYSHPTQFAFAVQHPVTGFIEQYTLPEHSNSEADLAYEILTTKAPVSISQGGTGANTAKEALQSLGICVKPMPEDKDANSCTELGVYFFPYGYSSPDEYSNLPTDLMSAAGFLLVIPYGSYIAQLWFSIGAAGMYYGLTHTRIALPSGWRVWHQANNHSHKVSDITDAPATESGECELSWSVGDIVSSTTCKYTRHGRSVTVWGKFPYSPDVELAQRGDTMLSGLPFPGTLPQGPVGFCTQMTSGSDAKITSLYLGGGGTCVYTFVEVENGGTQGAPNLQNIPGSIQFTYIID